MRFMHGVYGLIGQSLKVARRSAFRGKLLEAQSLQSLYEL